jgi:hypothetical protein
VAAATGHGMPATRICRGGAPGETVAIDRASLVRRIEEDLRQGLKP